MKYNFFHNIFAVRNFVRKNKCLKFGMFSSAICSLKEKSSCQKLAYKIIIKSFLKCLLNYDEFVYIEILIVKKRIKCEKNSFFVYNNFKDTSKYNIRLKTFLTIKVFVI